MSEDKPLLLIIDDQMDSLALLMSFLADQSMDIRIALDGRDGLQKALRSLPDIILLDVHMPGMDGYAVCRQLKAEPATAGVPVLFLSGSTTLEDRLEGFSAGGVDYIGKPFSAEEVLARLFVHLRLKQRLGQLEAIATREVARESYAMARSADPVTDAIGFLQQANGTWPGLEELAHRVGTNGKKLTELFRQRFGMPVFEYQGVIRLEMARRQLESTELPVKLIADRAGYSNSSAFTRAFGRRYGLPPKDYRQSCRKPAPGQS